MKCCGMQNRGNVVAPVFFETPLFLETPLLVAP